MDISRILIDCLRDGHIFHTIRFDINSIELFTFSFILFMVYSGLDIKSIMEKEAIVSHLLQNAGKDIRMLFCLHWKKAEPQNQGMLILNVACVPQNIYYLPSGCKSPE